MKYCGQVNIPTVNNNAIACKNYYDTDCVIYQDPIPYFGTVDPSTSTEVFDLIISSLSDARSRIVTLESAGGITFDLIPTDGSTNAVQSNGIFDALAIKLEDAPIDGSQYVRLNGAWTPIVGASNVLVGDNVAVATTPLPAYTSGTGNTAFGDRALENASVISGTVAVGDMAGFYASATESPIEGITTELTNVVDGIFIGQQAKPANNNSVGEIVIGARAHGNGNNTTTIGGFTNVETYLRGDVLIEAAGGNGDLTIEGVLFVSNSASIGGNIAVSGTVDGRDVAADGTKLDGIEAGATADQLASEVPIVDAGLYFTATDVEGALQELAAASGGITDGDKGDITVSGGGATWTIDPQAVTFGKIQNVTTGVFAGRISSGAGSLEELSGADATTLLSPFSTTTTAQGVVPGSNNLGATYYLDATGNWSEPPSVGGGNTLYSADDSLAGPRIVTMGTNQLSFSGTGGDIVINSGRLGVSTAVFGGSRLGDSLLQAPSADFQSINFKDSSQNTALAIFTSPIGAVPGDGFVTTMKNFTDNVNVISIAALDANQLDAGRQVEATIGLRNDYLDNSYTVLDMFNQDYPSGISAEVRQKQGWVAINGGGAAVKPIGLWRYNTVAYTNIWELDASNVWTFGVDVNVPDEAYAVEWNGSTEVPTKNAVYDKIESLDGEFVNLTTNQTIAGEKTFIDTAGFEQINFTPTTGSVLAGTQAFFVDLNNQIRWTQTGSSVGVTLNHDALTANRVYSFPNQAGTFALTTDIPDNTIYVDRTTSQTIGGVKTFNDSLNIRAQVIYDANVGATGYVSGGAHGYLGASQYYFSKNGGVNVDAVLDFNNLTLDRTFVFPDNGGTIALTSDLAGAFVDLTTNQTVAGQKTFSDVLTVQTTARIEQYLSLTSYATTFASANCTIHSNGDNRITFKQGTVNNNTESMAFDLANITAHRVVTWPDKTGTVAFLDDVGGGANALNDLTDVTITVAAAGEYLRYNGAAWVDSTIQASDIPTLSDYVAVSGDTMTGPLTMASNILADTSSTRAVGQFSTPFFDMYSRRFVIKKNPTAKSWRFEGNDASGDLGLNIETTANTDIWSGIYTFNGTGDPVNPTDLVDLAYLEANFMELTGNQTAAGIKTFSDSTASTTKDTGAVVIANGGLGVEGAINAGGDITAFASSDPRLKDDMTRISNPMNILSQLSGYNFVWNDKQDLYSGADVGLNALEVQEVIPSAVRQSSDSVGGWLQVDYKKVIPVLVEAVKEKDGELKQVKEQLQLQGQELQDSKRRIQELEETVRYLLNKVG